ncbi:MAG TPA: hypothetical protein VIC05_06235 [Solirubrobacteraceae bacterium]|jgi:hypothetical protein
MTGDHTSHKHAPVRALVAALLSLTAVAVQTPQALAWTVSPADIHVSSKPGAITRGSFEIITSDSVGRRFRVVAQDLGETPEGSFTFTTSSHTAAQWIDILPSEFTGSRQPQSVDYAISVPTNATPGDHVAAISVQEQPAGSQGNIGVVEAVGIRLVIRVPGTLRAAAKITQFAAPALTFGNGVAIHAAVVNTGDTVLDFNGANSGSAITVGHQRLALTGLLLPGATRVVSYGWNSPPLVGTTKAQINVNLGSKEALAASKRIFAFPLYQVLGLALLVMAVILFRRQRDLRRRRRNSSRPSNHPAGGA